MHSWVTTWIRELEWGDFELSRPFGANISDQNEIGHRVPELAQPSRLRCRGSPREYRHRCPLFVIFVVGHIVEAGER